MHLGNISFHLHEAAGSQCPLELAPAYDMLPMRYAPLSGGEVPVIADFSPSLPLPGEREQWRTACHAAVRFWQRAGDDPHISLRFRETCRENGATLTLLAKRVYLTATPHRLKLQHSHTS